MLKITFRSKIKFCFLKMSFLFAKENISENTKENWAQICFGHNSLTICLILLLSLPDYKFVAYLSVDIQLVHTNGHFMVAPIWPYLVIMAISGRP